MLRLHVQVITEEVYLIARNMSSFCSQLRANLASDQALLIAEMFPGGVETDKIAIGLCDAAIAAAGVLLKSEGGISLDTAGAKTIGPVTPGTLTAIDAIFMRLKADLTALAHGQKHNIGYYIKVVGIVIEDIISQL